MQTQKIMKHKRKMELVKELWSFPDTVHKHDGYDMKTLPEATADNMEILMNKINELIQEVNELKERNESIKKATE